MTDIKKRAERNGKIRRTISQIEGTIRKLESMKTEYMQKAVDAKSRGESASYNLLKSAINATLAQEKRAKEMLLNIKITAELQRMGETNADFLSGMSTIAKSISKVNKKSDFVKLQKEIEKALSGMEEAQAGLDGFLQNTDAAFATISSAQGALTDSEIDSLIDGKVSERQLLMDEEIEKLIADLNGEKKAEIRSEVGVGDNVLRVDNGAVFAPAFRFDFGPKSNAPIPNSLAEKFVKLDVPTVALASTAIDLTKHNSVMILGGTNALMNYIVATNAVNLSARKVKFVSIDLGGNAMSAFNGTSIAVCNAITDASSVMPVFKAIEDEIDRRYALLRETSMKDISEYCGAHGDLPYIVVAVNRLSQASYDENANAIKRIMAARAVNMGLIVRTDNDSLYEALRPSVHCAIARRSSEPGDKECTVTVDGRSIADRLPDVDIDDIDAVISILAEDRA